MGYVEELQSKKRNVIIASVVTAIGFVLVGTTLVLKYATGGHSDAVSYSLKRGPPKTNPFEKLLRLSNEEEEHELRPFKIISSTRSSMHVSGSGIDWVFKGHGFTPLPGYHEGEYLGEYLGITEAKILKTSAKKDIVSIAEKTKDDDGQFYIRLNEASDKVTLIGYVRAVKKDVINYRYEVCSDIADATKFHAELDQSLAVGRKVKNFKFCFHYSLLGDEVHFPDSNNNSLFFWEESIVRASNLTAVLTVKGTELIWSKREFVVDPETKNAVLSSHQRFKLDHADHLKYTVTEFKEFRVGLEEGRMVLKSRIDQSMNLGQIEVLSDKTIAELRRLSQPEKCKK